MLKKWIGECFFNLTVAVVLAAAILLIWRAINPPAVFTAEAAAVAALRMPPSAMSNLYYLSQAYDIPFDQVLAMYAVANNFFPQGDKTPAVEMDVLHRDYVSGFNRLRRRYSSRAVRPYIELFQNLVSEFEYFPVPVAYEYDFSDTWEHSRGTAILDKMNIRGRIPVLSMTDGHIGRAAWHYRLGYHVVVVTGSGSRILYAHLDSLADDIASGRKIAAGQNLGMMGNSGTLAADKPVHLHISISPAVSFAKDFWINPYPFLRYMEEKMYIFP